MDREERTRATAVSLQRLMTWTRAATRGAISSTTLAALDTLDREGEMRVSDLAGREGITQPGMTALVNRLTEAGWARKLPDSADRRAALVRITPAGIATVREHRAARTDALVAAIASLDADQQDLLLQAREVIEELSRRPVRATLTGVRS